MARRLYTREFKISAIALLNDGKTIPQLSKELDIPENNLYNWRAKLHNDQENIFINEPQGSKQELELRRLRTENIRLKEERDIFKKAAVWFAKESEQSTR